MLTACIKKQIEVGALVCPVTKENLRHRDGYLESITGVRYLIHGATPVLLAERDSMAAYARASEQMNLEYTAERLNIAQSWYAKLRRNDYRTKESVRAQGAIFENLNPDAVCLSVGGGPGRSDPRLTNLNIDAFPNVDVVGDAHRLPYADASVDAIFCEAVIEHLHSPAIAVAEMHRVLRKGARIFACTPFLQPYHGYPHHYQNYTITGHCELFKAFNVLESGASVGPTYAIRSLIGEFLKQYPPFPLNKALSAIWSVFSTAIAPLDRILGSRPDAHIMASTTFLLAEKR